MKTERRFVVMEKEGSQITDNGLKQVLVDLETGVQYLWIKSGYAGGLTPLLDVDGKPLLYKSFDRKLS